MRQTSRGKFNRLQRATAEFTTSALDGYGLRGPFPARPAPYASYPVLVHRLASLLHASFRPRLTTSPLRFAIPSPPPGWEEDFHLQAVKHARHTTKGHSPRAVPLLFTSVNWLVYKMPAVRSMWRSPSRRRTAPEKLNPANGPRLHHPIAHPAAFRNNA